jgi:glucose/arabinose dehydrogenase
MGTTIDAVRVTTGLSKPLFATAPSGDLAHLFIVEKGGQIELLDLTTNTLAQTPFLDVSGAVATVGEEGLLGLAFHPGFATNGRLFIYLSNLAGDTEIREYHVSADPSRVDPVNSQLVLGIDQPDGLSNHKGGWIGFGPDGDLYIATGDGGGAGDPFGNGQNAGSLLGKMLRVNVDSGDTFPTDPSRNYAIPSDNPFALGGGAPEIWAWGLRNPWRASFDRATGELWIGDVGEGRFEEIDLGAKGANYGWNLFEGLVPFTSGTSAAGLTLPLFSYSHDLGTAVTGGYVYRGPGNALQGTYVFADFGSGRVFALERGIDGTAAVSDITGWLAFESGTHLNSPTTFGEDAQGQLYVADYDGAVFRLTPRSFFSLFRDDTWSQEAAASYSGPVSYLQYQLLGNAGGEVAVGTAGNDFINLLGGDDAANGGDGNDVLDGGTGSNFLTGGAGSDVFFLDGRSAQTTWSTITDWQAGEQLSLWSWKPGVSRATWVESAGTAGYEGATLHCDLDGNGSIDASVTWSGLMPGALPTALEFDDLLWIK